MITLRLRHLDAIYGRNFLLPSIQDESIVKIHFAISTSNDEQPGYVFVSDAAENDACPEWDPLEIRCPWNILSSKSCKLTFFVSVDDVCSILFEIDLHFSGLVLYETEMRENSIISNLDNQVFFRFRGEIYVPQNYFPNDCGQRLIKVANSSYRYVLKPSYDFAMLQRFVVNSQISNSWSDRINALRNTMKLLNDCLHSFLDQDAAFEDNMASITLLKRRIRTSYSSLKRMRKNLEAVTNENSILEAEIFKIDQSKKSLDERLTLVERSITNNQTQLLKLQYQLSRRTRCLIRELADVFSNELGRTNSKTADELNEAGLNEYKYFRIAQLSNLVSDDATGTCQVNESNGLSSESETSLDVQNGFAGDPHSRSVSCGIMAQLLKVLTVILDQPLRYNLDLSEGCSRSKIVDQMTSDLNDSDRVLPLYISKNSLFPAYKHALYLFNQNILSLLSTVGAKAPLGLGTMFNLKALIEHILRNGYTPTHSRSASSCTLQNQKN